MMKNKTANPLVRIENLHHSYKIGEKNIQVLKNIYLTIEQGQSLAIMGPSGSGKSTLLHLIGCLERLELGSYWLNQQEIARMTDWEMSLLRSSQIGFVFQSFNLISHLNVYENAALPFSYQISILPSHEVQKKVLSALDSVQLTHRLNHLPSQLSGGECQRVAIARALAISPLLMLADEPTGNLDSETGNTILQTFKELNRNGATLVIVTHDPKVAACCESIRTLQDGELL